MHTPSGENHIRENIHFAKFQRHAAECILHVLNLKESQIERKKAVQKHLNKAVGNYHLAIRHRRKKERAMEIERSMEQARARRNPELALS